MTRPSMMFIKERLLRSFVITFSLFFHSIFEYSNELKFDLYSNVTDIDNREAKFFPVISFARFANTECVADDLRNGTCYNFQECKSLGGIPINTCAAYLGRCCVFESTCGGQVTYRISHFVNPSFPSKDKVLLPTCPLKVILPIGTCRVLLKFLEFNVSQPDHDTVCRADKLWFSKKPYMPHICGSNYGQHMFINVEGESVLDMAINAVGSGFGRVWNIKIEMLACNAIDLAPVGCLQYFTQTTGTVLSFNFYDIVDYLDYPYDAEYVAPPCATHLASQNYGICVKRAADMCQIEWTADTFEITGNETCPVAVRGDACQSDYVMIPAGRIGFEEQTYDRYCGFALNVNKAVVSVPVRSDAQPFLLRFVTDNVESVDEVNRGFKLNYQQIRCEDCR